MIGFSTDWLKRGEPSACAAVAVRRCDGATILAHQRPPVVHVIKFAVLGLLLATSTSTASEAQETDFTRYVRAANYCRGDVPRPMALAPDKQVLCFDGGISADLDLTSVNELADGGIAVVRGWGIDRIKAATFANVLRDRHAIVVVYDACLADCASYLLLSSTETYVLKGSLVAWGIFQRRSDDCFGFAVAPDHGPRRLDSGWCGDLRFAPFYDEQKAVTFAAHSDFF